MERRSDTYWDSKQIRRTFTGKRLDSDMAGRKTNVTGSILGQEANLCILKTHLHS